MIVNVVRRSSFVVRRSSFVVVRRRLSFVRWCNAFFLSPHDFSERLKIWNFGKDKKVSSRWVDVQQKENFEKVIFLACVVVFSRKLTFCLPPPHDFSKRLKIWNFGKDKKVSSQREDVQQKKKIRKKSFLLPVGRFLRLQCAYIQQCWK